MMNAHRSLCNLHCVINECNKQGEFEIEQCIGKPSDFITYIIVSEARRSGLLLTYIANTS